MLATSYIIQQSDLFFNMSCINKNVSQNVRQNVRHVISAYKWLKIRLFYNNNNNKYKYVLHNYINI